MWFQLKLLEAGIVASSINSIELSNLYREGLYIFNAEIGYSRLSNYLLCNLT